MVSGLIVIGIIFVYIVYSIAIEFKSDIPPIRDYERYNKESVSMSEEELKEALKNGRWS